MWSFSHNFFNFDPHEGDFNVGGQTFQWNDGIFSITLGKRNADGYRTAYFHPMVSGSEFIVNTRVLQDEHATTRSNHGDDFKVSYLAVHFSICSSNNRIIVTQFCQFQLLGRRGDNSQSAMHQYDAPSGVIFYSQVAGNGVACWNTNKPFSERNHAVIASDSNRMIYPADLTVSGI